MLKIVGASFGRTGTTSVRLALEALGFGPCHYMRNVSIDPSHAHDWLEIASGAVRPDWDKLFSGYASTIAWPAAFYWRELVNTYPAAKVLLIVRDPESWYESVTRTLFLTRPINPIRESDRVIEHTVWDGTFGGRFTDRDHALGVYKAHLDDVRANVPARRLVEVEASQGWQPLCDGLGVPVPSQPFPFANTTKDYLHRAEQAGVLPEPPNERTAEP
jgi:hypothetical protein